MQEIGIQVKDKALTSRCKPKLFHRKSVQENVDEEILTEQYFSSGPHVRKERIGN